MTLAEFLPQVPLVTLGISVCGLLGKALQVLLRASRELQTCIEKVTVLERRLDRCVCVDELETEVAVIREVVERHDESITHLQHLAMNGTHR